MTGGAVAARWAPLAVVFAVSLVVLFSPGSAVPTGPPGSDKVVHAVLFAALAATSLIARIPWWATLVWLAAYAALSEVLQATLPIHRSGDIGDWLADVVGALVATALAAPALWWVRRRGPVRVRLPGSPGANGDGAAPRPPRRRAS